MNPKGRKKPKLKIRIPTPKPTRFHSTPKGKILSPRLSGGSEKEHE
jgi:hypothetical protein